ncbi:MAG: DMT family transporter [Actinomycetota bacterium]|nr:DMT family transporter [Actinomycetota bacterium]
MTRGYVPLMLLLAAVWGASYLFIKVAVEEMSPAAMVTLRLVLASAVLVGYLGSTRGFGETARQLRRSWRDGLVLGTINAVIPFTLIAWGEQHVDSGVAAIANATVPIFTVLLAIRFLPSERATGTRLAGVALGLVGVGVLVGVNPRGGWWAVAGGLAVVVASLSYAGGGLYVQRRLARVSTPVLATASMLGGTLILLPFGIATAPSHVPSWKVLGSVAALGIAGTGFAQVVYYRLVRNYGSARSSLVTYLLPPTALIYGVLLLDEPLTVPELAGLGLILAGVAFGSGLLGRTPPA